MTETDRMHNPNEPLNDEPSEKPEWHCRACPVTSEDVERLELNVTYDEALCLCSKCRNNLTSVTLALVDAIVQCNADAGESLVERVANLEEHVLGASEDGSLDVQPAPPESPDSDADDPEARFHEGVNRCAFLFARRDELLGDYYIDAFAARYSETNAVLNRQWGAINEVRKLLGLDTRPDKASKAARNTVLGAVGGALLGAWLLASKTPLENLSGFAKGALHVLHKLGVETPELPL